MKERTPKELTPEEREAKWFKWTAVVMVLVLIASVAVVVQTSRANAARQRREVADAAAMYRNWAYRAYFSEEPRSTLRFFDLAKQLDPAGDSDLGVQTVRANAQKCSEARRHDPIDVITSCFP